MGELKNVTTSIADAMFTGFILKKSSINYTTKGGVSWCLYPVKPITNSSILNLQMTDTNDCYKLLLKQETASSPGLGRGRRRVW